MAKAQADGTVEITGQAPLYKKVEPLTFQAHGKLGLIRADRPFAFADGQHFVPLQVTEFPVAATSFPIVFAGDEMAPIGILGLTPGENLYRVGLAQRPHDYIPAYFRRFPFAVANDRTAEGGRSIICIDVESPLVSDKPDQPFFDKDGKFTPYTENCIRFCQNVESERLATIEAIKTLRDLDLFEPRTAQYTPVDENGQPQEPQTVASFNAISQEKVNALPIEKYAELRDSNLLMLIYAHWLSQWQWDRLIKMSIDRRQAAGEMPTGKVAGSANTAKA